MEWVADPDAVGAWLRERFDDHEYVPHGFPAYARVFHPARVRSLPDRPVPDMDEWVRLPDAEQQRLIELFDDREITWTETAAVFGTAMHPLAQWQRIVGTPEGVGWQVRIAADGREFTSPDEGGMPPSHLAVLASHLIAHTTTPDAGFAAIWEGWGDLVGALKSAPSGAHLEFLSDPNHQTMLDQSIHDRFNNPFAKPTWHPGILSDEISKGPRLELPDRSHVLFFAAPSVFADPGWILDAPWRNRPLEELGFEPRAEQPSILWPQDRAWVMVSEIDFDSTIVAGSAELIAAICADGRLEALPIPDGADLSWTGDEVNP
ncbi:hypothetical protein [Microbacterium sp. NPDC056234]|uniref:hypothetical protein n=1 Tax=Microbacterium sp. NPDC056234 TaxID=3345757 RepID=UPI0035DCFC8A